MTTEQVAALRAELHRRATEIERLEADRDRLATELDESLELRRRLAAYTAGVEQARDEARAELATVRLDCRGHEAGAKIAREDLHAHLVESARRIEAAESASEAAVTRAEDLDAKLAKVRAELAEAGRSVQREYETGVKNTAYWGHHWRQQGDEARRYALAALRVLMARTQAMTEYESSDAVERIALECIAKRVDASPGIREIARTALATLEASHGNR